MKNYQQVFGVHSETSNYTVYGELGVYLLGIHIKSRIIGCWSKLTARKETKVLLRNATMFIAIKWARNLDFQIGTILKTFVIGVVCQV